ncbi:hypothetical protein GY45DRAFT_1375299 [Cubamyces sp. BRFM 1775]|nr:hypothetical protein GY45DRAFT_1375299 [Cubamyces sp. BRFM 1775]
MAVPTLKCQPVGKALRTRSRIRESGMPTSGQSLVDVNATSAKLLEWLLPSVVSLSKDREHVDRLGLLHFSRPHDDVKLATVQSHVLQREGFT